MTRNQQYAFTTALLIACLFFASEVNSQSVKVLSDTINTANEKYFIIQQTYKDADNPSKDSSIYFLADNKFKILLQLNAGDLEMIATPDSTNISDIAINGKTKAVLLKLNNHYDHSYGGLGGGFEIEYTRAQIWSLTSKKLLFDFYTYYHSDETHYEIRESDTSEVTSDCLCAYNFCVCSDGTISIEPIKVNEDDNSKCERTNSGSPGRYKFRDGYFDKID